MSGSAPTTGPAGELYTKVPDVASPAAPTTPAAPAAPVAAVVDPARTPDGSAPTAPVVGGDPPADPAKPEPAKPDEKPTVKAEDYKLEYPKEIPEGAKDETVAAFLPAAAKHGLTNEQVQGLINDMGPALRSAAGAWEGLQTEWQAEFQAHPVIGGQKFAATVQLLNEAIPAFAAQVKQTDGTFLPDPAHVTAIKQALSLTGAGNNAPLMHWIHNMASRLREGTPVNGSGAPQQGKDTAALLYPSSTQGAQPRT